MMRDEAERLARRLEEGAATGPEGLGAGGDARAERAEDELAGLVSLAQTLETSAAEPQPRFPTALRERVLATVAEEPPQPAWRARLSGVGADIVGAWRYSVGSQVASGALTAVLLLAALFVGAGLSVPGDPLYALKDVYQQAQLSRASAPVDVASVQLSMASTKIEETVRAADRDRPDSVVSSATDAERLTRDSAETLLEVYRDTGDEEVLAPLATFVQGHRPIVAGLQERTADVDVRRALANLMITLDRVEARAATALGGCCPPEQQASAFWVMSSPHQLLRECPCPGESELADDEADDADDGAVDDGEPVSAPTSGPDTGDVPTEEPERLREDMREGWDETREGLRDTVDDATEDTRDTLDDTRDTLDGADDELLSPEAGTTDGAQEELDESDELDGGDGVVDETGEAVDDLTDEGEDTTTDGSDPVDELLEEQLDAQSRGTAGSGSDDGEGSRAEGDDGEGDDGEDGEGGEGENDDGSGETDRGVDAVRDDEHDADAEAGEDDGDALP